MVTLKNIGSLDESIAKVFTQAIRARCAYHVVQKTYKKHITKHMMKVPPIAKDMLCHIKHWIYSWGNGLSCYTEEEYKFLKDLLLYIVQTNKDVENALGRSGIEQVLHWLNVHVLVNEPTITLWPRAHICCFDEYMNNSGEAMNYASKKADIASKPNMDMHTGANAMLQHSTLKAMDRRNMQARRLSEVPLYVKPGIHNIQFFDFSVIWQDTC